MAASHASGRIACSVRSWAGEYWSRDVPGGVETVPYRSSAFVVPSDGSAAPRKVVDVEGRADVPGFSPDREWVYFQAPQAGHAHIFRCRDDGSSLENLTAAHTPPGDRYGYKISRDGTRALFTFHDGSVGRVGIMNPDGSDPRLIAPDIGYHYMADISPDNRLVAFAHTEKGYLLCVKDVAGGELRTLLPNHPECFCPQFTPDGGALLFTRRDGDIYRVGVDGTGLQRLTQGNGYISFYLSPEDKHGSSDVPSLSPDGTRVAYIAKRKGIPQLHVMDVDGGRQRQITARETPCGRATFGPDGRHVAFVSWDGPYTQLFVVAAEGGATRKLTDVRGAVCSLQWEPIPAGATALPRPVHHKISPSADSGTPSPP